MKIHMVGLKPYVCHAVSSLTSEGGLSLDSRSADKEQKAVTPEKSKACVTTFAKKVGA